MIVCSEEVVDKDGFFVPCDRPYVAVRFDPEFPGCPPYPVCEIHDRP